MGAKVPLSPLHGLREQAQQEPFYLEEEMSATTMICGTPMSEHDRMGNCLDCPVCKAGMCPSDDELARHDGEWLHWDCLRAKQLKAFTSAVSGLLAAYEDAQTSDIDSLHIASDRGAEEPEQAYLLLKAWATRNAHVIERQK